MNTAVASSAVLPQVTPLPAKRSGFWGDHLSRPKPQTPWLWQGLLGPGQVTLLTSQWKSGKTTLISILLSRLKAGGQLADLPLQPAKAIVVSEESEEQWQPRHHKLDLSHVYFLCRPFDGKPTVEQWLGLLDEIGALHREHNFGLLAIDTLATFLPAGSETNADCLLSAVLPLQRLTRAGLAALLAHHPKKGVTLPGQAFRGTGALGAFADVILEMQRCPHAPEDDRRRRLLGFSRSSLTPRQLVLELNPEATDYLVHGDFLADEFTVQWDRLRMVLEDADDKLTRQQIIAQWPADFPCPADSTLWNWLQRAATLGLIAQQGSGRKADPFRYWLPAKETAWRDDPIRQLKEMCEQSEAEVLKMCKSGRSGA